MSIKRGLGLVACMPLAACVHFDVFNFNPEEIWWNQSLLEKVARGESRNLWKDNGLLEWRRGGALPKGEALLLFASGTQVRAHVTETRDGRVMLRPLNGQAPETLRIDAADNVSSYIREFDSSRFERVRNRKRSAKNFREAVNQRFFYGRYRVLTADGHETDQTVNFLPDGRLEGTDRFTRYSLCMSAGCGQRYQGEVINLLDGDTWYGMVISRRDGQWLFSSVRPEGTQHVADQVYLRLLPIPEE